jgi:hypothetical protein
MVFADHPLGARLGGSAPSACGLTPECRCIYDLVK